MKITYDYLKKLLETFASSDKAVIDYNVLKSATLTADANTFLFHLQQVEDALNGLTKNRGLVMSSP